MTNNLRVRVSIQSLQKQYEDGDKKPLEDLMRAWKGVKDLPPDDPRSFYMLGGYHGAPFRGAGWGSSAYWGGYCNHGNILFPTWHRVYLHKLEEALRSIPGCEDVTLPFWDECAEDSLTGGIPWALTVKDFELDGATISNPLRSFVFPVAIMDHISGGDPVDYGKPKGYETVRYPLSGLVGPSDIAATRAHNAKFPDYDENVKILNKNIVDWLTSYIVVKEQRIETHVAKKFKDCLNAPNYTVFSNTTSAAAWNDNPPEGTLPVVPLESPHNNIHLAVGGCEVPGYNRSPIDGANGDMGENDTAGLDPIFYFHHCFVDRVFWLWQERHGATQELEIIERYPGTNSVDGQNPTPGTVPNSWLTLDSPLDPFKLKDKQHGHERPYTSRDAINIEDMGYTYGPGSLEDAPKLNAMAAQPDRSVKLVRATGANRASIAGSFLVSAFINIDGVEHHLGSEAVLSRWHVEGCANCQTHLDVRAVFPLNDFREADLQNATVHVKVHDRKQTIVQSAHFHPITGARVAAPTAVAGAAPAPAAVAAATPPNTQRRFRVVVE